MARGPRIIQGARSPAQLEDILATDESERQKLATLRAAGARSVPVASSETPAYPVRFVCEAANLILSLDIPQTLPDGAIKHNRFNVRFENGSLDIRRRTYPFSPERVSEAIRNCSGYGLGQRFWDYDEQERALNQAQKDQALRTIRTAVKDPELRAALRAELKAETFDLGEAEPQSPGTTP